MEMYHLENAVIVLETAASALIGGALKFLLAHCVLQLIELGRLSGNELPENGSPKISHEVRPCYGGRLFCLLS
jgi:hypothetical protein